MPANWSFQEPVVPVLAFETDEPSEVLQFAQRCFNSNVPVALVTLVEIKGGAARSLGAHMAVAADGRYCGFVSGGCTESAVAAEAIEALHSNNDRFLKLGEGSPFFDIVLPCGGGINLSIHIIRDASPIQAVIEGLLARRPASLIYSPNRQAIRFVGQNIGRIGWDEGEFVTVYEPRTRILFCGRSIELTSCLRAATALGFDALVIEKSSDLSALAFQIDEFTAVAFLLHDLDRELPVMQSALRSKAFYIGALGSVRTHEKRLAALHSAGFGPEDTARIKAPIGIFGKARDAVSIALSVLADIAATKTALRNNAA